SATMAEDSAATAISVLTNDTDADSDTLTLTGVTAAQHGTAVANANGTVSYTPVANYHGSDAFTYSIVDNRGGSATGPVNVTVTNVNDAPVATNDAFTTNEDTPATGNVLTNDTDADLGTTLTAIQVTGPAHGTLALNATGSFTYTPAANYNGSDSFTYKANDG